MYVANVLLPLHHGFLWHHGMLGFSLGWQWAAQIYLSVHISDHQWGPVATTANTLELNELLYMLIHYFLNVENKENNVLMYLSKVVFVCCNDLLPLCIASWGDQVQYGLLITTWGTQTMIVFNSIYLSHGMFVLWEIVWICLPRSNIEWTHLPIPFIAL